MYSSSRARKSFRARTIIGLSMVSCWPRKVVVVMVEVYGEGAAKQQLLHTIDLGERRVYRDRKRNEECLASEIILQMNLRVGDDSAGVNKNRNVCLRGGPRSVAAETRRSASLPCVEGLWTDVRLQDILQITYGIGRCRT